MPLREHYTLLPGDTPLWMYAVFALFAAVFVAGLVRRLRPLSLRGLLRATPRGARAALRRLVAYGLLQRRVAERRRDWPHVALFSGFLILTLGTALVALDEHILNALGLPLLRGGFYLGFEATLDFFGVLLVAGSAAALLWRLRRPPPPTRSPAGPRRIHGQYLALLAALLFVGVTGFMLEGLRLTLRPVAWAEWSFIGAATAQLLRPLELTERAGALYTVLWWSHAIAAFGLIAAIPYTVLVHWIGAPMSIALFTGRPQPALDAPFDLRALIESGNYDVKAGTATLADLGDEQRLALLACTDCGRCDDACPAGAMGENAGLSPRQLVQSLRRECLSGHNGDLLAGTIAEADLWACTTCASCVQVCPVLIRPSDYVVPFRRELVRRQRIDARQSALLGNLGRSGNPYGSARADRAALPRELGIPTPGDAPAADYLYWMGCAAAYDTRVASIVKATMNILRSAGVTVAALGEEEACTGDAARRLGEEGLFQQLALRNIETLEQHGVRRILTHCAHCFNALRNEYPRFGADLEVVHHIELIARLVREGRVRLTGGGDDDAVTVHDACYVARYNRILDAPRDALRAIPGLRLTEMPRNRERSFCCGAGGARYWYEVPRQEPAGAIRVREARAVGARVVATECPFCLKMLEDAASASPNGTIEIRDVAEIVAAALPRR